MHLIIQFIIDTNENIKANRDLNPTSTTYIRHNGQEVRIHMPTTVDPPGSYIHPPRDIQPPPPAFDPQEPPPPSYQDFRKDVQIQSSSHS